MTRNPPPTAGLAVSSVQNHDESFEHVDSHTSEVLLKTVLEDFAARIEVNNNQQKHNIAELTELMTGLSTQLMSNQLNRPKNQRPKIGYDKRCPGKKPQLYHLQLEDECIEDNEEGDIEETKNLV
ncbi:hypothetical protein Tco_1024365 [Tanacetum coccineum]